MGFNKQFFEKFEEQVEEYRRHFWTGTVTVTLRIYEREFNVKQFVQCEDNLLTFAYYELEKQRELPQEVQEKVGRSTAYPMLVVPYEAIFWVEMNPGKAQGKQGEFGFQPEK